MKNINIYDSEKYKDVKYTKVAEHIYETEDKFLGGVMYVTSLSFEQEVEYGEGKTPSDISQYPLEDILDEFCVAVEDFYEEKNASSDVLCYQEFCGKNIDNIKNLLGIVGKHVFNKEYTEGGEIYVKLVIE
ncbi:MAG: hypothetical protein KAZ87_08915 [Spirochaetes bacterium]|nr:hypothetical protein [Spirochaetota bacterium]